MRNTYTQHRHPTFSSTMAIHNEFNWIWNQNRSLSSSLAILLKVRFRRNPSLNKFGRNSTTRLSLQSSSYTYITKFPAGRLTKFVGRQEYQKHIYWHYSRYFGHPLGLCLFLCRCLFYPCCPGFRLTGWQIVDFTHLIPVGSKPPPTPPPLMPSWISIWSVEVGGWNSTAATYVKRGRAMPPCHHRLQPSSSTESFLFHTNPTAAPASEQDPRKQQHI